MELHDLIIFGVIAVIVVFQLIFFLSNFNAIRNYKNSLNQIADLEIPQKVEAIEDNPLGIQKTHLDKEQQYFATDKNEKTVENYYDNLPF